MSSVVHPIAAGVVLATLATFALGCGSVTPTKPDPAVATKTRAIAEQTRRQLDVPGISIAVMRGSRVVLAEGYGAADPDRRLPARADTVYQVGSITKQVTAAAILALAERGQVSLDAPVATYLPELPPTQPPTLVHHLLAQTSGLPEYTELAELRDLGAARRLTQPLAIAALAREPRLYAPGSWWSYSNSNYLLLGAIVERVTGGSLDEFFATTFFRRLGMASTRMCVAGQRRPGDAIGYRRDGAQRTAVTSIAGQRLFSGSGGLCSTVVDLLRWKRALIDGRVVSPASFAKMTSSAPVTAGFTPPYGYGVSLIPAAGQPAIWHTGVSEGFTTALVYLKAHDLIIAISANHHHVPLPVAELVRSLLDAPAPPLLDLPVPAEERERVIGTYDDYLFRVRIYDEGGALHAHVSVMDLTLALQYQGNGEFVTPHPAGFRFWFEPLDARPPRLRFEWAEVQSFGRKIVPATGRPWRE